MRRLLLGIAVLALAAIATTLVRSAREPASPAARAPQATDAQEVHPEASAADVSAPQPPESPAPLDQRSATSGGAPSEPCTIRGRVLGSDGEGVAGVEVRLCALDGPWWSGPPVGTVACDGQRREGVATTTGQSGAFSFRVPAPTASRLQLSIDEGPGHSGLRRVTGPDPEHDLPSIVPGKNALGDLVVDTRGVLRGTVRGSDGRPIEGARLWLGTPGDASGHVATSDRDGRFEFRAPCGKLALQVRAERWSSQILPGCVVAREAFAEPRECVLGPAPSIEGRVVDAGGFPCASACVEGAPKGYGRHVAAATDADGRFTLWLGEHDEHRLQVLGRELLESASAAPGARDVLLVVEPEPTVLFRVVAADTGEPVTRFELHLADSPGTHPQGLVFESVLEDTGLATPGIAVAAVPGEHHVGIRAEGFAPLEAPVRADPGADRIQTLRLTRGATLEGRLRFQGGPARGATLKLLRERVKLDPTLPDAPYPELDENYAFDLGDLAGAEREWLAGSDGSFRAEHLAAGTYLLRITGEGFAKHELAHLRVPASGELDLGVVELGAPGRIDGVVLVAPGLSAGGRWVTLMERTADPRARATLDVTGPLGDFTFQDLRAGAYLLALVGDGLPASHFVKLDLDAGEQRRMTVDLRAIGTCRAEVLVRAGGSPVDAAEVRWVPADSAAWSESEWFRTDALGVGRGEVPAGIAGRFEVVGPAKLPLGRSPADCVLPIGGLHAETLDFEAGSLVLELPASCPLPDEGELSLYFRDPASRRLGPRLDLARPGAWTGRTLELGRIGVGEHQVLANVESSGAAEAGGTPRTVDLAPLVVRIRAGETTRASWPP